MIKELPVGDISPNPRNPRENFNNIDELAESIEEQGLLTPVLVRPVDDGYELVHGERRLRAIQQLDQDHIKAEVRQLDDETALEISITENLQREDVSCIAEARSYQQLIDEFDLTQAEAADRLGVSQPHISSRLGLLDMPDRLQQDIIREIFTPKQAEQLARVWGEYWLWDIAVDWDLSVRQLRSIVDGLQAGDERVAIEQELSFETVGQFWDYADDDVEGRTKFRDEENAMHTQQVNYVDGQGQLIETVESGEVTGGILWAKRNLDTDTYDLYGGKFEGTPISPVQIHWPSHRIIYGYHRLMLADREGYRGDFDVEIVWPASFFEWESRVGVGGDGQ